MKKCIALIAMIVMVITMFGFTGCSSEPGVITIYEFADSYQAGTPITKNMVRSIKVKINEGFVGGNGTVYTTESLAQMMLVTKDNWGNIVKNNVVLSQDVYKGSLFQTMHVTTKPVEFDTILDYYRKARDIYQGILSLDYRIAAGIEDPLLIAPEYEHLLEQINALAIQCQAVNVPTQYTQLQTMLNIWITTDIAVYCQNMSAAISRNDVSAAERALEYRTMVYNDFSVITANIAAINAQVDGADIRDITEWSPEKYIKQQGGTEEILKQMGLPSSNNTNNGKWWENIEYPKVDPEWTLDPEIPANYIPVPGSIELYMVIDENGEIIKYRERTKQEDGSWVWKDVNPDIPDDYEPVPGLENVYKVTNKDGTVSYYKYIRNDDDTFAFVPVDENGNPLKTETEDKKDPNAIPKNYIRIKDTNIFGVYNEHGVCIGYKERRLNTNTGNYYWIDVEKPTNTAQDTTKPTTPTTPQNFISTEVVTSTEVQGDWLIIYETTITKVYAPNGELLSTEKDSPKEVSRISLSENHEGVPDQSKIAPTLHAEYVRVTYGLVYKEDVAGQVLQIINEARRGANKSIFIINSNSEASLLAAIKAGDMAIYNHSDYDSPMYGTAEDLCERYEIAVKDISEIQWKAYNATAEEIARRLYLLHGDALTNENYSDIGLSIVATGAYYYIDLILIKN